MSDDKYMGWLEVSFSPIQEEIVYKSTMVYRDETIHNAFGDRAEEIIQKSKVDDGKESVKEIIAMLGKGSGKNFSTTISMAYIVHLLLCLKDPAKYFSKPSGDTIDLLNIATNAKQAKSTFFQPFKQRIKGSEWFAGRFDAKADHILFDKSIRTFSGHSEMDAWEGYNLIFAVLDEIAAFRTDEEVEGSKQKLSASEAYDMTRNSVTSRFPDVGKVVLLSFPRYKRDFINMRYDEVVEHKETELKHYTYKRKMDLPDGVEGNELRITWEHDRIVSYSEPNVYAIRRTAWEVNPTRVIEEYKGDFFRDKSKAYTKFACMPPESVEGVFKDIEKVDQAFPVKPSPFDDTWRFAKWFKPSPKYTYYIHVDLAEKKDRAAVAIAHSPGFVKVSYPGGLTERAPRVIVDAVRWWEANDYDGKIPFGEIRRFLLSLRQRGFTIGKITFDQWQSISMQNELRARGVETETLSVGKNHYDDMVLLVQDERLHGYKIPILRRELLELRQVSPTKVDHPPSGSKDLADAVCGASYMASLNATENEEIEIEIDVLEPSGSETTNYVEEEKEEDKPEMPPDIEDFLSRIQEI